MRHRGAARGGFRPSMPGGGDFVPVEDFRNPAGKNTLKAPVAVDVESCCRAGGARGARAARAGEPTSKLQLMNLQAVGRRVGAWRLMEATGTNYGELQAQRAIPGRSSYRLFYGEFKWN